MHLQSYWILPTLDQTFVVPFIQYCLHNNSIQYWNIAFIFQCPRTEAVTFLASLLSLPESLLNAPMVQPYPRHYTTISCPDLKVDIILILSFCIMYVFLMLNVSTGTRIEYPRASVQKRTPGHGTLRSHRCTWSSLPSMLSRKEELHSIAWLRTKYSTSFKCKYIFTLNIIWMFLCKNIIFDFKLQMKNKNIAKVASDILLLLADYTDRLIEIYPGLTGTSYKFIKYIKKKIFYLIISKCLQRKLFLQLVSAFHNCRQL